MTQNKESIAFRLRSRSEPVSRSVDLVRPSTGSSSQPITTTSPVQSEETPALSLVREDSASTVILINSDEDEDKDDLDGSYDSNATLPLVREDSASTVIIVNSDEDEPNITLPYLDSDDDDYYDDYYDEDHRDDAEPRAKVARLSDGTVVMPNLLEGVAIPEGPARTGDECSVCLDPPVHPVTLPCGHVFCFLCAKGLTRQSFTVAACSLCRQEIPADYLERSLVLEEAQADIDSQTEDSQEWAWFYKGGRGWWMFEERNNEELEEAFRSGQQRMEMMICGHLYVIDFVRQEQYQKNMPTRKRQIKRDLKSSERKGVAGLQTKKD